MNIVKARNANQALPEMMWLLSGAGDVSRRESRNGPVLQLRGPTTIQYVKPLERVVYWPERDANPFFHLMESLWMLGGRNDVAYVSQFSSNIGQFSDDGVTFHGAYGFRWRKHFGIPGEAGCLDQLLTIAQALKANPDDRRQVLQMWDACSDLGGTGKDLPCNLMIVFQRNEAGSLDMTVFNRSNDIVWGALGANCVHMSVLQEYMAYAVGCPVGQYWQVSTNMHGYLKTTESCLKLAERAFPSSQYKYMDPYNTDAARPFPLMSTPFAVWNSELEMFLSEPFALGFRDPFFRRVAVPMANAYRHFKTKDDPQRFKNALSVISGMADCDWKLACREWLERRSDKAAGKK